MQNETTTSTASAIRHVAVTRDGDGRLLPAAPVADLGAAILRDEQLVILRGAYSRDEMRDFRRVILDWGEANEAWPQGVSAGREAINFHRVDDGSITGRMAHIFHQFGFGDPEALSEPLRDRVLRYRGELFALQNRLAGTDFPVDSPEFRLKAIRHPRGGGYLVPHAHPFLPQKVAIFLNLSEPGVDYHSGSARFRLSNGDWCDTHADFRCGDLIAWRYSMVHELSAVDPGATLDWSADDGLWIFAIEWVSAHDRSSTVAG